MPHFRSPTSASSIGSSLTDIRHSWLGLFYFSNAITESLVDLKWDAGIQCMLTIASALNRATILAFDDI